MDRPSENRSKPGAEMQLVTNDATVPLLIRGAVERLPDATGVLVLADRLDEIGLSTAAGLARTIAKACEAGVESAKFERGGLQGWWRAANNHVPAELSRASVALSLLCHRPVTQSVDQKADILAPLLAAGLSLLSVPSAAPPLSLDERRALHGKHKYPSTLGGMFNLCARMVAQFEMGSRRVDHNVLEVAWRSELKATGRVYRGPNLRGAGDLHRRAFNGLALILGHSPDSLAAAAEIRSEQLKGNESPSLICQQSQEQVPVMAKAKSKPAAGADVRTPPSDPGASTIGNVGLGQIRPSPLNPRKTFADDSLAALADSIAQQGLLQPLVVRPMGDGKPAELVGGKWKHLSHFELLAGERRFRALTLLAESNRLPSDRVPVNVRWLSDAEALAVMLVENDQREDVRPSEQAAGYKKLLDELGTVNAVIERTGKPAAFVRQVLALGKLPPWALVAVDAGELKRETAALVARVPGERARATAAACVLQGQHNPEWLVGTPEHPDLTGDLQTLTFRETKELIRRFFQVELKGAPFDRKALYVLPGCEPGHERHYPPCEVCPERAGNDPEATAEGVRGDVCLNPGCYREKCEAHKTKVFAKYAKDGIEPADLDRPWNHVLPERGWCDTSRKAGETELCHEVLAKHREEKLKELLSVPGNDGITPWFVALDPKGKAVTLVKTADARKALQCVGVIQRAPKAKAAAKGADADLKPIEPVPLVKYRVTLNDTLIAALRTLTAEFEAPADRDPADWYVREMAIHTVSKAVGDVATSENISCVRVEEPKAEPQQAAPASEEGTLLADVPDFPTQTREYLWSNHAVRSVEQITDVLGNIRAEKGRQNATIFDALKAFGVTPDTGLYPAGDALVDHLDPITMPLEAKSEPKPAKKAKVANTDPPA